MSRVNTSEIEFDELLASLGIDDRIRASTKEIGFKHPTLVQLKCLPLSIEKGRDLLVRARTGSGKTLAYAIPVLHKLLSSSSPKCMTNITDNDKCKAIILVPTRELCYQVQNVFFELMKYCDDMITIGTICGNSKEETLKQEAILRDAPTIVISTPASLMKHVKQKNIDVNSHVEMVVLDEADLILSYGYREDMDELVKYLPKIYQGLLMSATLGMESSNSVEELGKILLHNPITLKLEEDDRSQNLMQYYLQVPKNDFYLVLYVFIKLRILNGKGLFFVNSIDAGYKLKIFWEKFRIRSAVINSRLPHQSRVSMIQQFNSGRFDFLIATDESAESTIPTQNHNNPSARKDKEYGVSRGLDFYRVDFVVNVDFPLTTQSYTHRIGRTARGDRRGIALTLLEKDNEEQNQLLSLIQSTQPHLPLAKKSDTLLPVSSSSTSEMNNADTNFLAQPSPLDFDLRDIEGFRYRVNDVKKISKGALRAAKTAEITGELLNSEKLQSYFMEHKSDYKMLLEKNIDHARRCTIASKHMHHLGNVPDYILPRGMEAPTEKKKRRQNKKSIKSRSLKRNNKHNDPLQSYDNVTLDEMIHANEEDDDESSEASETVEERNNNDDEIETMKKVSGFSQSSRMVMSVGHVSGDKRGNKRGNRGGGGKHKKSRKG